MKKTGKIVAVVLAALLVVAAVAVLASCGTDYEGYYDYERGTTHYGVKVTVTVSGNTITAVKLWKDSETNWVRTSTGWKSTEDGGWGMNEGDLGFDAAEAAYDSWISENIVGKTVDEVLAMNVSHDPEVGDSSFNAGTAPKLAGATQSSIRIILAVQNALKSFAA